MYLVGGRVWMVSENKLSVCTYVCIVDVTYVGTPLSYIVCIL